MWQQYGLLTLYCLACVSAQIIISRYVARLRDENARMRHLLNLRMDELTADQYRELHDLLNKPNDLPS